MGLPFIIMKRNFVCAFGGVDMKHIEMKYYNTYYYCNIIVNVINDIEYLTKLNEFFEGYFDESCIDEYKFPRDSILHDFSRWVIEEIMWEEMDEVLREMDSKYSSAEGDKGDRLKNAFADKYGYEVRLQLEYVIESYTDEKISFKKWLEAETFDFIQDAAREFFWEYDELRWKAIDAIADEIFYLLFQNREFLLWFNESIASWNKFRMNRCTIPEWVKRVIRHRDKGRCVFCGKDVVGVFETQDNHLEQFDHIVPLHEYGINDISNMQLTCDACNNNKSTKSMTNNVYVNWYDKNEQ